MKIQEYHHLPTSRPVWIVLATEGDPEPQDRQAPWIFKRTFPHRWEAELALRVFTAGGKYADYRTALKSEKKR